MIFKFCVRTQKLKKSLRIPHAGSEAIPESNFEIASPAMRDRNDSHLVIANESSSEAI